MSVILFKSKTSISVVMLFLSLIAEFFGFFDEAAEFFGFFDEAYELLNDIESFELHVIPSLLSDESESLSDVIAWTFVLSLSLLLL